MQLRTAKTVAEQPSLAAVAARVCDALQGASETVTNPLGTQTALHGCLYDFQAVGAFWLAPKVFALLADEPGTGKSVQAIGACDLNGAKKILVVCPAPVIPHWVREFQEKSTVSRRILAVYSSKHLDAMDDYDVVIISQDLLHKNSARLTRAWEVAIVDESHGFKNPDAKRTQALLGRNCNNDGILIFTSHVWFLTASPAPNHPAELWTMVHAFLSDVVEGGALSYYDFAPMYATLVTLPRGGVKITGGHHLDELRAALAPYVLRRLKIEVLRDLPGMRITLNPIYTAPTAEIRRLEALEAFKDVRRVARDIANSTGGAIVVSGELSTYLRVVENLKTGPVASILENELTGTDHKIVVFVTHRATGDRMMELLAAFNPVRIVGGQSPESRKNAIDAFQTDPGIRVCVASIQAASVGITLTAACDCVFLSSHWTPELNMQAVQRLHRIGQTSSVHARFFTLANSVDELVMDALVNKTRVISELFDQSNYGGHSLGN